MKYFLKKYVFERFPTLRIPSVTRISLDMELLPLFAKLKPGVVLDIGAKNSPYKQYIPHEKYFTLDVDPKTRPDICGDLHEIKWESNYFDTVIATEVLEHVYEPKRAIGEMFRILKKGGVCVASTRFIYVYHPDPKDYYRFTEDSLGFLFNEFSKVSIYQHGNGIQALWHIINNDYRVWRIFLNIINPLLARITIRNTKFPLGYIVVAEK